MPSSAASQAAHGGDELQPLSKEQLLLLVCHCCRQLVSAPVLLPCLHACCSACARRLHAQAAVAAEVPSLHGTAGSCLSEIEAQCPSCREPIRSADVDRENRFLATELYRLQSCGSARVLRPQHRPCDCCKPVTPAIARHWCSACRLHMCDDCLVWHGKFKKQHPVVELSKIGADGTEQQQQQFPSSSTPPPSAPVCSAHLGTCEALCLTCVRLGCSQCTRDCQAHEHDVCNVRDTRAVDEVAAERRANVRASLARLRDEQSRLMDERRVATDRLLAAQGAMLERLASRKRRILDALDRVIAEAEREIEEVCCTADAGARASGADEQLDRNVRHVLAYADEFAATADQVTLLDQQAMVVARVATVEKELEAAATSAAASCATRERDLQKLVGSGPDDLAELMRRCVGLSHGRDRQRTVSGQQQQRPPVHEASAVVSNAMQQPERAAHPAASRLLASQHASGQEMPADAASQPGDLPGQQQHQLQEAQQCHKPPAWTETIGRHVPSAQTENVGRHVPKPASPLATRKPQSPRLVTEAAPMDSASQLPSIDAKYSDDDGDDSSDRIGSVAILTNAIVADDDDICEPQPMHLSRPTSRFKTKNECCDISFTADGCLLVAMAHRGLRKLAVDGTELGRWQPPHEGDFVTGAEALADDRIVVGLRDSQSLLVIRQATRGRDGSPSNVSTAVAGRRHRHGGTESAAAKDDDCCWVCERSVVVQFAVHRLAACGLLVAASGGPLYPGRRVQLVSLADDSVLIDRSLDCAVYALTLTDRWLVLLAEVAGKVGEEAIDGNRPCSVQCLTHYGGLPVWSVTCPQWSSDIRASPCGRLLYLALPYGNRVCTLSAADGRSLTDVCVGSGWSFRKPAWLAIAPKASGSDSSSSNNDGGQGWQQQPAHVAVLAADLRSIAVYSVVT